MSLGLHPLAADELTDAVHYYATVSAKTANAFYEQYLQARRLILTAPQLYPVVRSPNIRKHVMQQFTYSVIYRTTEAGDTQILALAHHKRRPFYWAQRA
jgi:plasmid stabilization system protein ParE